MNTKEDERSRSGKPGKRCPSRMQQIIIVFVIVVVALGNSGNYETLVMLRNSMNYETINHSSINDISLQDGITVKVNETVVGTSRNITTETVEISQHNRQGKKRRRKRRRRKKEQGKNRTDDEALTNHWRGSLATQVVEDDGVAYAYSVPAATANFTWSGERWIPPNGRPYFLPKHINSFFRSENTLWWGDSTGRQDYQTAYHLIHHNFTKSGLDVQNKTLLNEFINKGKKEKEPIFYCPARSIPKNNSTVSLLFRDLGQVKGTDENCSVTLEADKNQSAALNSPWERFALNNRTGKFDFAMTKCYHHILSDLEKHRALIEREYSVLIFSAGIWEVRKKPACARKTTEETTNTTQMIPNNSQEDIAKLLNFLEELSGPSLFIIWKTHGPSSDQGSRRNRRDQDLIRIARDWFWEHQPAHMDLVDFRWAIHERAFGTLRIKGDLPPHWGLHARLLSIEMISEVVARKQRRTGSNNERRMTKNISHMMPLYRNGRHVG